MSVLETRGISVRFGGVYANTDVSISVGELEIVGIIGPNGAGKTTVFNVITGFYKPDRGRVIFKGRDVTGLVGARAGRPRARPHVPERRAGEGQRRVRENLLTAQYLAADYSIARRDARRAADVRGRATS